MAGTAELLKALEVRSTADASLRRQHEDEHLALDAQQVNKDTPYAVVISKRCRSTYSKKQCCVED